MDTLIIDVKNKVISEKSDSRVRTSDIGRRSCEKLLVSIFEIWPIVQIQHGGG